MTGLVHPASCGVYLAIREEAKRIAQNDPALSDLRKYPPADPHLTWATLVVASLFARDNVDERTRLLGVAALCAVRAEAIDHERQRQAPRQRRSDPPKGGARRPSGRPPEPGPG